MALAGFGVVTSVAFFVYYVMPYQTITGTRLAGGGIDWFSGESLHAFGWAVVCIPFAILAYRVVHRSYGDASANTKIDDVSGDGTRDLI